MRRVAATLAGILAGLVPIDVFAFHEYSVGYDTGSRQGNNYYSGVSVQRYDGTGTNFQMSTNSDCSVDFVPPIAYQSMWVAMDQYGGTWVELGTAHKTCTDGSSTAFWFGWMKNPNGFNWWVFTQQIYTGDQHRFFVVNGTDGNWRWYVDQTQFYNYYWPNLGFYDAAGLESYDGSAGIHEHFYDGMVKTVNWSSWEGWQPSGAWSSTLPMGGNYVDDQDAYAYENTP